MIILKPDTKKCMSELLLKDTFDSFLLIEGDIITFNHFHIDGYIQKDFFDADTLPTGQYSTWQTLQKHCFSLIKGYRAPLSLKLVLALSKENVSRLFSTQSFPFPFDAVQGLYLNFNYNEDGFRCITGVSFHTFIPDKTLEHLWDIKAQQFFVQHQIPFTLME